MAQQPEIVPQGTLAEKYQPVRESRQASRIELALVALIVLFVIFAFAVFIIGTAMSVETANNALPKVVPTPK